MTFWFKDLAFTLAATKDGDKAWMVMIGCGPKSARQDDCGTGTQPPTRLDPIDSAHGLKDVKDLVALKQALKIMLEEKIPQFEEQMKTTPPKPSPAAGTG